MPIFEGFIKIDEEAEDLEGIIGEDQFRLFKILTRREYDRAFDRLYVVETFLHKDNLKTLRDASIYNEICPECGNQLEPDLEDSSELYCSKCNYGFRLYFMEEKVNA